jgi:hypothetical protein
MRNAKFAVAAAAALFAGVQSADAARLYFSTVGPGSTPAVDNPVVNVAPGQTFQLHLWAELSAVEQISGLGIDILSSAAPVLQATAHNMPQVEALGGVFRRWELGATNPNPGVLGDLVTGINAVAVNSTGLGWGAASTFEPTYNAATSSYHVSTLTIQATAEGTTQIFIESNEKTISFKPQAGQDPITSMFFGTGDASVDPRTPGVRSALPDATITVIPEPASLSLLALGALPMLRRRRA